MTAITTNSIIVATDATVAGKLTTFERNFDNKADAWHYINVVRSHAFANAAVTICNVIVFDASQRTGSISRPFKELYRETLKK